MQRLISVLFAGVALCQHTIDLSSQQWTLKGPNVTVPGSVPSQAHLDLYAAGAIGDPLYGENDTALLWVQRSNWTYSSTIPNLRRENGHSTWLVFDGIDTFASIELCGQFVANVDNQFRQWYFDVTDVVKSCKHDPELSLNFGSASKIVKEIARHGDPLVNSVDGGDTEEFCCKEFMRKEQSDFGWDWAPKLAPAGIWQPGRVVQLNTESPAYVRNALIDIYRKDQMNNIPPDQSQPWVFNASLDYLGSLPRGVSLELTLNDANGHEILKKNLDDVHHSEDTITGSVIIDPRLVELWWPINLGSQPLYDASIKIVHGRSMIAEVERRVGFRTIVMNLLPITKEQLAAGIAPGSNFHFEVNGHEFYAKGSNLVPPDVFWPRVNETKMRNLFEAVAVGNQNMLRVWSSGAYLPDWIYEIADEMGIFLWSEFEFSDAEYPANASYLSQYKAEASYQVRRVNHHPSLAVWVGGNELEQIMLAYFFSATDPGTLLLEYQHIFMELLIGEVYANSRSISYMPSSTYHGFLKLNFSSVMPQVPRYLNTSGPNYIYADTDDYNYDASQAFELSSYPIGRFATEFGFHSMPSVYSWEQAVPADQLSFFSDMVIHRNRHYPFGGPANATNRELSILGLEEMTTAVQEWYPIPNMKDSVANFTAWCWTTQVFQADYYTSELAFYRRGSGMPQRNLGSLYWQLEDLWTSPTWASIEADGRWKVLFYRAKDIFEPVIGYPYYNTSTGDLEVWATSDLWSPVHGTVKLSWMDWTGKPLSGSNSPVSKTVPFTVGGVNSTRVMQTNMFQDYKGLDLNNTILRVEVNGKGVAPNDRHEKEQTYKHTSFFHPQSLQNAKLQDPGLKVSHVHGTNEFDVTATKGVAAWVWLDYPLGVQGYFSDNGFWLTPGETRNIHFTVKQDWTDGKWVSAVTYRSIWNNTLTE
ncbi:uncharacterized protein PFLUO_LOCUS4912 [Penicillium psychrofluorescens]|uniref:uncharacterized protein n=1 Tax=Penicillium psychrofluorescens TaxID=3158075 RepID=UPI003CCD900A